jgi:hypothetical protein
MSFNETPGLAQLADFVSKLTTDGKSCCRASICNVVSAAHAGDLPTKLLDSRRKDIVLVAREQQYVRGMPSIDVGIYRSNLLTKMNRIYGLRYIVTDNTFRW